MTDAMASSLPLACQPRALLALSLVSAQLPPETRLLAAAVCRAWRATLTDASEWSTLELEPAHPVREGFADALLRAAAAHARGGLKSLTARGCFGLRHGVTYDALRAVAVANAGALRELRLLDGGEVTAQYGVASHGPKLTRHQFEDILAAAPWLRLLEADVELYAPAHEHGVQRPPNQVLHDSLALLSREGAFMPLRVRRFDVMFDEITDGDGMLSLAAALAAQESLTDVLFTADMLTQAQLDALVDAALVRQLRSLTLSYCGFEASPLPALSRLLHGGPHGPPPAIQKLCFYDEGSPAHYDANSIAQLAEALRVNNTLTQLSLCEMLGYLWHTAVICPLLGALVGHPTLRCLIIGRPTAGRAPQDPAALGTSFAALLAADSPALQELHLNLLNIGDAGLAPMLDALPRATRLRLLDVTYSEASDEFAVARLLPAMRRHPCLRALPLRMQDD